MKISHKVSALVVGSGLAAASLMTAVSAPAHAASHPVCTYHFAVNTNIRAGAGTQYIINGVGLKGQTWVSNPLTNKHGWIKGYDSQTGKHGWVISGGLAGASCGHQM